MEIKDIYIHSQIHKIISLDKSRGMLSHAYLLECSDEVLLEDYVLFAAKDIMCKSDMSPCLNCNNCNKIEHGNMVDLKIFPKDKKGLVVEDINEIVADSIQRPMDSEYKIYILNNFDKATIQSQNKILKTLEEPPRNVIFLLTCCNSNNVLQTIKSRVKIISENLISLEIMENYLKDLKVKDYLSVASISGGSVSTAMKLASGGDSRKILDLAIDTLLSLRSSSDILKYSTQILSLKKDFVFFVDTMIALLRDIIIVDSTSNINFKNEIIKVTEISKCISSEGVYKLLGKFCEIYNKLEFNCNLTGVIEQMLLDILEVKFLCQK